MKSGVIYGHKNENTDICIRNQNKNIIINKKRKELCQQKIYTSRL